MNDPLKNIRDAADKMSLSQKEKAYMRAQIFDMIKRSNAQAPVYRPTRTPYFFFAPRFALPFAALLILTFGTSTTYAAYGAIPGDVLYPVKIYVNENIEAALAFSDEAKVSYHTAVAEERLKEAEALASQGKLDASATLALEANFNEHAAKADELATQLEEKEDSSGVEAKIALNSSLSAHSAILSRIGEWSDDEQTKENSITIADRARSRGLTSIVAIKAAAPVAQTMAVTMIDPASDTAGSSSGESANARATSKVQSTSTALNETKQKNFALQLQKKASRQFEDTQVAFDYSESSLDASTTQKITTQLSALEVQLIAGKQQIKNEDYIAARATFSEVLRGSIELKTFIEASKTYKKNNLNNSWWGDDEGVVKGAQTHNEGSNNHDIKIDLHL